MVEPGHQHLPLRSCERCLTKPKVSPKLTSQLWGDPLRPSTVALNRVRLCEHVLLEVRTRRTKGVQLPINRGCFGGNERAQRSPRSNHA